MTRYDSPYNHRRASRPRQERQRDEWRVVDSSSYDDWGRLSQEESYGSLETGRRSRTSAGGDHPSEFELRQRERAVRRSERGTRVRRAGRTDERDPRISDREVRRTTRTERVRNRSVGADVLAFPTSRTLGRTNRSKDLRNPSYDGRWDEGADARHEEYSARPAVYTDERRGRSLESVLPTLTSRGWLVFAGVAVFVALIAWVVFNPARTYYLAWREAGVLEVEYEVLSGQNDELNHELERLQSLEGVEDEARRRGYVYPNEEALVVDDVEETEVSDPELVEEKIAEYEESLPWFVHWLDSLYGYHRD